MALRASYFVQPTSADWPQDLPYSVAAPVRSASTRGATRQNQGEKRPQRLSAQAAPQTFEELIPACQPAPSRMALIADLLDPQRRSLAASVLVRLFQAWVAA